MVAQINIQIQNGHLKNQLKYSDVLFIYFFYFVDKTPTDLSRAISKIFDGDKREHPNAHHQQDHPGRRRRVRVCDRRRQVFHWGFRERYVRLASTTPRVKTPIRGGIVKLLPHCLVQHPRASRDHHQAYGWLPRGGRRESGVWDRGVGGRRPCNVVSITRLCLIRIGM